MGVLMKGVVMFVLSICCLFGALAVDPAAVEFLGEKAEPEIRTGCVVYGGEYLNPPYVVKRGKRGVHKRSDDSEFCPVADSETNSEGRDKSHADDTGWHR